MEVISNRNDPAVQRIADISKPTFKPKSLMFLEDAVTVDEALNSGVRILEVYAQEGKAPANIAASCAAQDVPFREITSTLMSQLFKGGRRPETFAVARVPREPDPGSLDTELDLVVLDGVRIVGNIGAIVRTSFALGAGAVVLVDSGLDSIFDRRLIRASRGYVFRIPVLRVSHEQLHALCAQRWDLVKFSPDGGLNMADFGVREHPVAMVYGSEVRGLSADLDDRISASVKIPMPANAESLNVSVAVGIGLYERLRCSAPRSVGAL